MVAFSMTDENITNENTNINEFENKTINNVPKVEKNSEFEEKYETETPVEMNFLEHLGELRKRLIISVLILVVCSCVAAYFSYDLMKNIFLRPAIEANLNLQNLQPFGQPFLYFKVIAVSGLIVAMPFILYQFWLFISPALYENERKWVLKATFFTSFCFICGIIFSYIILIPSMLEFAANFGSELIENNIDVNQYFGFISTILLASGILFQLPIVSYILTKMEIITPKLLSKYRRHAIVGILILAAVLTPTPDPISQLIFATPIFALYEISILISWLVKRKQ
jgi:sec-independent protein translocase protein TatC